MGCCQCKGIEVLFNEKATRVRLESYRKNGSTKTTRMLVAAMRDELAKPGSGIEGVTLLDIVGGVGAIQHEFLRAGIEKTTGVV